MWVKRESIIPQNTINICAMFTIPPSWLVYGIVLPTLKT
jgi:hypothetical protein